MRIKRQDKKEINAALNQCLKGRFDTLNQGIWAIETALHFSCRNISPICETFNGPLSGHWTIGYSETQTFALPLVSKLDLSSELDYVDTIDNSLLALIVSRDSEGYYEFIAYLS